MAGGGRKGSTVCLVTVTLYSTEAHVREKRGRQETAGAPRCGTGGLPGSLPVRHPCPRYSPVPPWVCSSACMAFPCPVPLRQMITYICSSVSSGPSRTSDTC